MQLSDYQKERLASDIEQARVEIRREKWIPLTEFNIPDDGGYHIKYYGDFYDDDMNYGGFMVRLVGSDYELEIKFWGLVQSVRMTFDSDYRLIMWEELPWKDFLNKILFKVEDSRFLSMSFAESNGYDVCIPDNLEHYAVAPCLYVASSGRVYPPSTLFDIIAFGPPEVIITKKLKHSHRD